MYKVISMNIKLLELNGDSFLDDFVHDTNSDSRHFSRVDQMDQILAAVNPNAKELLRNRDLGTQAFPSVWRFFCLAIPIQAILDYTSRMFFIPFIPNVD